MIDAKGRSIEYLRLSLTQQCNLRCIYCNPGDTEDCNLLSAADIEKVVRIMAGFGIRKVRLTGGEPLMRADLEDIIRRISAIPGVEDIPITTNAIGLKPRLEKLKGSGVTRLNISLDSLDREKYERITGTDGLPDVLDAIYEGLRLRMSVKVNVVHIRGINDNETDDFINLARDKNIEVRFIELMPIGKFGEKNRDKIITAGEVLAGHPWLTYADVGASGVAELYTAPGFTGKVGFIGPVSHKFCSDCNRIRMTADGMVKPCLGSNNEVDIRPLLGEEAVLKQAIYDVIYNKPEGHCFEDKFKSDRGMNRIGG